MIVVYRTRSLRPSQRYGWRLNASNGEQVAQGEGYRDRCDAAEMAQRVANGHYRGAVVRGA